MPLFIKAVDFLGPSSPSSAKLKVHEPIGNRSHFSMNFHFSKNLKRTRKEKKTATKALLSPHIFCTLTEHSSPPLPSQATMSDPPPPSLSEPCSTGFQVSKRPQKVERTSAPQQASVSFRLKSRGRGGGGEQMPLGTDTGQSDNQETTNRASGARGGSKTGTHLVRDRCRSNLKTNRKTDKQTKAGLPHRPVGRSKLS